MSADLRMFLPVVKSSNEGVPTAEDALPDKVPKTQPSSQENVPEVKSIAKRAVKPVDQPNRSHLYKKVVPWLKKPQYFSTDLSQYGVKSNQAKNNVAYNKPKVNSQSNFAKDRICKIKAIEKTFTLVSKPTRKHHSKPGVIALEEQMLFPDVSDE